ncbi:hypothetical protein RU07_18685 [Agrobacterium tumefaciens]|uniref:Spore coat protein U/FanG domain-containing protein n=1 Tax=Agrobacterium tumefaciens TaxID=358 RepID=A0A0D0JVP5_AGRTU|nr:hypothetical protein RU07_18685 [Agrobacterium tumefaciens]
MIRTSIVVTVMVLWSYFLVAPAQAQVCNVSMSNINFGAVNLLSGAAVDNTGTASINCANLLNISTNVRICLSIDSGAGGMTGGVRTMAGGSNMLQYQLYQDASRTIPWGTANHNLLGAPRPLDFLLLPLTTLATTRTVYARVLPNQQTVPGGAYSSAFSSAHARVTWAPYTLIAPSCASITQNPSSAAFNILSFVDRTCSVSAQTLSFGSHGLLKSQIDSASQIAVNCTAGLPFSISLNGGLANAAPVARKMTNGSHSITYGLFRDAARSQLWGAVSNLLAGGTGNGLIQNLTVYGRVPPQTTPPAGTYTDTVVVTVTY